MPIPFNVHEILNTIHHDSESAGDAETRLVRMLKKLSTLWDLNKALLTTVNLDRILHMTLTAVTAKDGLDFNRAMLFLVDENEKALKGAMAAGMENSAESERIRSALPRMNRSMTDVITELPPSRFENSGLNAIVRGIEIPFERGSCILIRTVLEKKPFNIQHATGCEEWFQSRCEGNCDISSEVGCCAGKRLGRDARQYAFAAVPLWGKGKVIGVMVVDNPYNLNPITQEDIEFLCLFSNQAGLAVENAVLYRNLERVHRELKEAEAAMAHQEKMAALGELSANIAHEIRNPLAAIGGFARRLDKAILQEGPERQYARTILDEVIRLEKVLDQILGYTRNERSHFEECDVRSILEESLAILPEEIGWDGIEVVREFEENLPKIRGNHQQLRQAFFNLIANAREAMKGEGVLLIRAGTSSREGKSWVKVEVKDSGHGIVPENLHNIFNPFFTSKESSLGLGLSMVHKIVTSHGGRIEVDNHPGQGATFVVNLPL